MIMEPQMMKISDSCNRKLLIDRFYPRHRLQKNKPRLISRMTPDVILWIRKKWIEPVKAEPVVEVKKKAKKKK